MTPKEFAAERNKLVRAVKAKIKPLLYPSGYRKGPVGNSRALQVWVPPESRKGTNPKTFKIKGLFLLQDGFEGFTEDGVIVDAFGGGLVTTYWEGIPIEDLYRIDRWLIRMLPKYLENKKAKANAPPVVALAG